MIGFVTWRLAQLVPVLLVASALIFFMMYAVPGGPVAALVGENATPEQIAAVTEQFGLNRPVAVQYVDWL
ncbi:MAG: ABC transporter permease, partial [Rhodospirillales bacterium]